MWAEDQKAAKSIRDEQKQMVVAVERTVCFC